MRYVLAVLGSCLLALSAWADTTLDFNPIYSRFDLTLDPSALGNVTGITVAMTGKICTGTDKLTTDSSGNIICATDAGGSSNSFETIAVPAGASVVADSSTDTLTITETSFLTITGTAA